MGAQETTRVREKSQRVPTGGGGGAGGLAWRADDVQPSAADALPPATPDTPLFHRPLATPPALVDVAVGTRGGAHCHGRWRDHRRPLRALCPRRASVPSPRGAGSTGWKRTRPPLRFTHELLFFTGGHAAPSSAGEGH